MSKIIKDQDIMKTNKLKPEIMRGIHSAESSSKDGSAKTAFKSSDWEKNEHKCADLSIHDKCSVKEDTSQCKICNWASSLSSKSNGSKIGYSKETSKPMEKDMDKKSENSEFSGKIIKNEKWPVTCLTPNRASNTLKGIAELPQKEMEMTSEILTFSSKNLKHVSCTVTRTTPDRACKSKVTNYNEIANILEEENGSSSKIPTYSNASVEKVMYRATRCTPSRACKNKMSNMKPGAIESGKINEIANENSTDSDGNFTHRSTPNRVCNNKTSNMKQTTGKSEQKIKMTSKNLAFSDGDMDKINPSHCTPSRVCKSNLTLFQETTDHPKNSIEITRENQSSDGNLEKVMGAATRCTPSRACKNKMSNLKPEAIEQEKIIEITNENSIVSDGNFTHRSTPNRGFKNKTLDLKQTTGEPEKDIEVTTENLAFSDGKMDKINQSRCTPSRASKNKIKLFEKTVYQPEITRQEPASITANMGRPKELSYAKDSSYLSKSKLAEVGDLQLLTSSMENLNFRKNTNLDRNKHKDENRLTVGLKKQIEKYCGSSIPTVQLIRIPSDASIVAENEDLAAGKLNTHFKSGEIRRPFSEKSYNYQVKNSPFKKSNDDLKPNAGTMRKVFKENSDFVEKF